MPAPFSPVHIPFLSGVRQDLGKLAQEGPSQLLQAQNVLFTRKGHITGRPGLISRDAQVQNAGGIALVGGLTAATAGLTPSGLVASGFGGANKADMDTPLLCYQGKSFFNRAGLWEAAGVSWSLRQTKSAAIGLSPTGAMVGSFSNLSVGKDVTALVNDATNPNGVQFFNSAGELKWRGTGDLFPGGNVESVFVAGQNLFFKDVSAGAIKAIITTGDGPVTGSQIFLGGGAPGASALGGLDVTTDGTFYYVAYGSIPLTTDTSTVLKVDGTGAVLQVLRLTWGGGAMNGGRGMSICYDPTSNRLGVAAIAHATGVVATKIITLTAGVMADAGIELSLTGAAGVLQQQELIRCGVTHNGRMSVIFSRAPTRWDTGATAAFTTGSVYVGGRLFTTATETSVVTLVGAVNSFGVGQTWFPLFAGQALAGRTLVGVLRCLDKAPTAATNDPGRSGQWMVYDFSDLYAIGNTAQRQVAAAGAASGVVQIRPGSTFCDGTRLSFGVLEGTSFAGIPDTTPSTGTGNAPQVTRGMLRRITLEAQGTQAVHVNGTTLLSGQLLHVFDGIKIKPHHFVEEAPYLFNGGAGFVYASNGGQLAAGSYSYQVTWETINNAGRTMRSGASNPLTVLGVADNQQVTFHATIPQAWDQPTQSDRVVVRFWATQTNPTNNAPKYLIGEAETSVAVTTFDMTFTHTKVSTGLEEQLYETVDTLADMRAPGADRGVAVVADRVWCADQTNLYASKLVRPGIAVSWNTEDTNVIPLPAALGTIQGLAAVDQGLVVLCSRGASVVTGPGVDDTGAGPGWSLQVIDGVPGMGVSSPRSCVATPAGAVFQAQDGDIWLVNSSGQATPMSRALRDTAIINPVTGIDLVNVTATPGSNSLLVAHGPSGILRVLDLEMGQWGTWVFPFVTPTNGLFVAAINGALWLQTTSAGVVFSADNFASTSDAGLGNITAIVETGIIRQTQPAVHGWGRLRNVILNEVRRSSDAQVSVNMKVLADQNDRLLMDKTLVTSPTNTSTFPGAGDGVLTFGTTVQRCAHFRVLMTITPAIFNVEGLDVWVANTGETAPSNNRS